MKDILPLFIIVLAMFGLFMILAHYDNNARRDYAISARRLSTIIEGMPLFLKDIKNTSYPVSFRQPIEITESIDQYVVYVRYTRLGHPADRIKKVT